MKTYTITLAAALALTACAPADYTVEPGAQPLSALGGAGAIAYPPVVTADTGIEQELDVAVGLELDTVEFEDPRAAAFGDSDYDCCYTSICRYIRDAKCADDEVPISNGIGSVCCQLDIGQCEPFPDADAGA